MKSRWIRTTLTLLTLCSLNFAGCNSAKPPKVVTVERAITAKGCTRAFMEEHRDVMIENIRLKADLKACHAR